MNFASWELKLGNPVEFSLSFYVSPFVYLFSFPTPKVLSLSGFITMAAQISKKRKVRKSKSISTICYIC